MKKILLLGGGGHAKCVIDALRLGAEYVPAGIVDVKEKEGGELLGVKIQGTDSDLAVFLRRGLKSCAITLGSVGDPARRIALWELAEKAGFDFPAIIHPSAVISEHAAIGRGVYVGPGAVINAGAAIGDGCIINTGAIVEHDCSIGRFVHVAPGAVLCGAVTVGDRTHLGAGCAVTNGVTVGPDTIVGIGSVLIRDIPGRAVCVGNPAKKIKSR